MRARPTQQQGLERLRARLQEDVGYAARGLYADGIAVTRQVLDGDPALFAADAYLEGAPLRRERAEPVGRIGAHAPRGNFSGRQVADAPQQIVQLIAIPRAAFAEPLQLDLQVDHGRGVEQLAQLLLAEQLAQALAVERKGLRASLRQRRIALVHVLGDVVEEQ